jgi:hypothetical protein
MKMESQYDEKSFLQQCHEFRAALRSRDAFFDYIYLRPTIDEHGNRNSWVNEGMCRYTITASYR